MNHAAGLTGSWTHSYEEDDGDAQVYRPTHAFAFPPSRRGRETLEFDGAGQMLSGMPGPDDRQRKTGLTVTPLGMNRFRLDGAGTSGHLIDVVESGPDLLKLRYV